MHFTMTIGSYLHLNTPIPPPPISAFMNFMIQFQASNVGSVIYFVAFWGESDDSNSEIEAALRPQYNTNNDNSEDF